MSLRSIPEPDKYNSSLSHHLTPYHSTHRNHPKIKLDPLLFTEYRDSTETLNIITREPWHKKSNWELRTTCRNQFFYLLFTFSPYLIPWDLDLSKLSGFEGKTDPGLVLGLFFLLMSFDSSFGLCRGDLVHPKLSSTLLYPISTCVRGDLFVTLEKIYVSKCLGPETSCLLTQNHC